MPAKFWSENLRGRLGRPRDMWEDNSRMDLTEIGWGVDWIHPAQDMDQ
jgi:hypothetical protein